MAFITDPGGAGIGGTARTGWPALRDASRCLPDSVPAHGSVYVGVDDTDAGLATIVDSVAGF